MGNPVAWFEVVGQNGTKLRSFYGSLFGWEISESDPDSDYGLVAAAEKGGEKGIAGGIGRSQDGGSGHVTFYVEVDDPAAYLGKVEELGGKTIAPPMDIEGWNLTIAFFADPEGHVIGLSRGAIQ
jgi:uncharacterized protein